MDPFLEDEYSEIKLLEAKIHQKTWAINYAIEALKKALEYENKKKHKNQERLTQIKEELTENQFFLDNDKNKFIDKLEEVYK